MNAARLVALFAAFALAACAPQPTRPPAAAQSRSAEDLAREFETLAKTGAPVYEVDATHSLVTIEVRRGGSLAHLGHDHVVADHDLRGYVSPQEGRADLYARIADFAVDEPELRKAAGFDTQPSASDIAGTRTNMLTKVLHADAKPLVFVSLRGIRANAGVQTLRPSVTLEGVTRDIDAEATIEATLEEMHVRGRMVVIQSDFGIVPLSLLGGAIQVQDALTVRFDVAARRIAP